MITILEPQDSELVVVGMVAGLGKGERIYSVRFIEETAYVVTFRQTDPLYTVDLSDPSDPKVLGELKILGYSAYLHPLGDDLLLGVGQDADERGRVEGTQVSIFDVSDPANPERIAQLTLAKGSNSAVEYDHRAFLYWDPASLAVIPIQRWSWEAREGKEEVFFGAIRYRRRGQRHPRDRRHRPPGRYLGRRQLGLAGADPALTRQRRRSVHRLDEGAATKRPGDPGQRSVPRFLELKPKTSARGSWILDPGQEWPLRSVGATSVLRGPRSEVGEPTSSS